MSVNPLAVGIAEAAELCGVSRRTFITHVLPDLAIVRIGRRHVIEVAELGRWLEAHREPAEPQRVEW